MAELNKYGLYQMGYEVFKEVEKDIIDKHIDFLQKENDIKKVREYIIANFGEFENDKWFDFPELEKDCYIFLSSEKIEFCAQKFHKQYFGKGWKKIKEEL